MKRLRRLLISLMITALMAAGMPMTAFAKPDWPSDTGIESEAGIVMDADSGAVLFGQNIHVQKAPASITKILTALVVIENSSLDDTITFSHDAVYNVEDGSGNKNSIEEGDTLSVHGFFSWRRTSGTLSFTNPRVYDTDLSLGNDLYYMHDYWDDFTRDTIGDSIRIGYPIGEYTTVGLGYRLERYEIYDVDENASPYITDYKGINWTSAISAHITRDTTDTHSNPHRGTIARLSGEWGGGGLGGSDNFIKLMADWQGFYSFNDTNTIHLRGRVGALFQNTDENIPVFERFYVGGMDTVRGYSYSDASPRSTDPRYDRDVIGGDYMGVGNFEYVWTFQKDMGLALVPFFDIGFNIDSKTQNVALDFDDHWVYSTGLELRWRSPMGDLRIAYGIPLKEDFDHENESGRLEFSMGQFF